MILATGATAAPTKIIPAPAVDPKPVIVIKNNLGGVIGDFLLLKQFMEKYKVKVVFDGPCISACTMLLRLPKDDMCVTKNASFWFHLATHPDPKVADTASKALFDYYPDWVRDFITERGGLTHNFIIMNYKDVKKFLPNCS